MICGLWQNVSIYVSGVNIEEGQTTNTGHRWLLGFAPSAASEKPNNEALEKRTQESGGVVMFSSALNLKVIPIVLTGSEGSVNTYKLLNEGSTVTMIEEKLAGRIGAFRIKTVGGARLNAERLRTFNVTIKGLNHHRQHLIVRIMIGNLNLLSQSVTSIVNMCRHLEDI